MMHFHDIFFKLPSVCVDFFNRFITGITHCISKAVVFFKKAEKKQRVAILSGVCSTFIVIATVIFFIWAHSYTQISHVSAASIDQTKSLAQLMDKTYPSQRLSILNALPYPVVEAKLDVKASSAILIDTSNGCILYEKNADDPIPPASMTKLVVMYIVFKDIAAGRIHMEDLVTLPENCWAINLPHDSSLMFLGQGQKVTLRELLTGLAVASGNDAAIAIADYISGGVEPFVQRMNDEVARLGLKNTHFVDASGYSEKNITTARDFISFTRVYITRYPEALTDFHSKKEINYPLDKNLPAWQQSKKNTFTVTQKNTNVLLDTLSGCDGLKTGYIHESGYNLALTAKRNGIRYLSITMQGPGSNTREGNSAREHDGTMLMEWAFSGFADYNPYEKAPQSYTVAVPGAKDKFVKLVPAWNKTISVPHLAGKTALDAVSAVTASATVPPYIWGETKAGYVYGEVTYKLGDVVLDTIPLVADRTNPKATIWGQFWGSLAARMLQVSK